MSVREALKEQYHAALGMLDECVEKCPDDLWAFAPDPQVPWRTYWRIAFHATYFTHLYLSQNEDTYRLWPERPEGCPELWYKPRNVEPYELPLDFAPYTKRQIRDYVAFVDYLIDPTVDSLDLNASESGFRWYPNMSKLSHQFLNLRHIQGHIGQLSELLMAHGIDTRWIGKAKAAAKPEGGF